MTLCDRVYCVAATAQQRKSMLATLPTNPNQNQNTKDNTMNDNIHDQIATLKDILHFAEEALHSAEKIKSGCYIDERLETLEEDYLDDLQEVLKLADEIRHFDVIAMS